MVMRRWGSLVLLLAVFLGVSVRAEAFVLIHELLADPPDGIAGDANHDGTRSTTEDEFVEIFNPTAEPVDLSGWSLKDATSARHIFADGTRLLSGHLLVIFGGGHPQADSYTWVTASSGGLSLNNSGDTISLFNADHRLIDQVVYGSEGGANQSLVRNPEGSAGPWIHHTGLPEAHGLAYSPGYFVQPPVVDSPGQPLAANAVPEPGSLLLLVSGCSALHVMRRKA
jgi:hypothetical protein